VYPPRFLEELKNKINLSDLVSKKVALKARGKDFVGLCPFHNEKTPSFTVNDIKGFYHCFGCSAHGDIFSFLMETEGLSFKEAIEKLATDNGIDLPKLQKSEKGEEERKEIETLLMINEKACCFFESNLYKKFGLSGLNYARKRGLEDRDLKKFRIGFAFDDFNMLRDFLKKEGFSEAEILEAGIAGGEKGKLYDKFRNRLMFPVIDKRGRVIAFTGRIIDDGMPKYMNSPETKIYHKGDVLFNYYFARKSIYDEKYAILVEGNLDAISLSINGVENVVAPMGTAITENQLLSLWKATDEIVLCLDGDEAGRKASARISKLVLPLINANRNIRFAFMPDGKDPDNFIKENGKTAILRVLKRSPVFIRIFMA
jgi:DNA primase